MVHLYGKLVGKYIPGNHGCVMFEWMRHVRSEYQTLLVNMWTVLPPCCWWMIFRLFFVADGSGIEGFLPDEFPLHIEVRGCPAGLVIDSRWFES